jgi:lipopolysaccharide transport system permease protein
MQLSPLELLLRQSISLTMANMKSRYRKTFAGFIWVLLNPLIMFGVQSLVFKNFLKLNMPDYYLYLVGGLLPWIFMTQSIQMSAGTLNQHNQLIRAIKIHPLALILSSFLDNLFNFFMISFIISTPVIMLSQTGFKWGLLLTPISLIPLIIGIFFLSSFLAMLNVFYRDTNFVLGFIFSVLFFITPIFYPLHFIPQNLQWIVGLNPLYHFIVPYRLTLYAEINIDWWVLWFKAMLLAIILGLITYNYWKKKLNAIYVVN